MRVSHFIILASATLVVAGCTTNWPKIGKGGYSEHRAPAMQLPGDPAGNHFALEQRDRYECENARLDVLRETVAARQTFTGQILQPQATGIKAKREVYGGLYSDAQISIDKMSSEITTVAEMAGSESTCGVPPPCDIGTRAPAPVAGMCHISGATPLLIPSVSVTTTPSAPLN